MAVHWQWPDCFLTKHAKVLKCPGPQELAVLGALFRSNDFRRKETELVILVTPYIATHASAATMAKPTDGYIERSELKSCSSEISIEFTVVKSPQVRMNSTVITVMSLIIRE